MPYQFTWNNNGYVRYDIAYQNIDHDNNPATPSLPGAVITVIYSDNATWAVTATDANACSTATLSFNNIPGGVNPNTLLDIDNYAITAQSEQRPMARLILPLQAVTAAVLTPTNGAGLMALRLQPKTFQVWHTAGIRLR